MLSIFFLPAYLISTGGYRKIPNLNIELCRWQNPTTNSNVCATSDKKESVLITAKPLRWSFFFKWCKEQPYSYSTLVKIIHCRKLFVETSSGLYPLEREHRCVLSHKVLCAWRRLSSLQTIMNAHWIRCYKYFPSYPLLWVLLFSYFSCYPAQSQATLTQGCCSLFYLNAMN